MNGSMQWTCSVKKTCLKEFHGTIVTIMHQISTTAGETTKNAMQTTKCVDGPSYYTPSKTFATFDHPLHNLTSPHHKTPHLTSTIIIFNANFFSLVSYIKHIYSPSL